MIDRAPRPLAALAASLDLSTFDSGEPSSSEWLARRAVAAEVSKARTYALNDGARVLAYYRLSAGAVERAAWPGRFRRNKPEPIPVVVLGRLAVALSEQRAGLGRDLLQHAIRQFLAVIELIGARALVVHALNDEAARYYRRFGFASFASRPMSLFLPWETMVGGLPSRREPAS